MKQMDIFDISKDVEKLQDGSNLITKPMETVMHESMMPYAEHVILDRALPRVEDGLKPVQRRILYSMYEQGVTPDKPYRKSARIVGDCLGRYHPHGDSSVYDAMVRMAQDFSMNIPLIEGQGNFGNIDGDSAAAMRYTEARLSPIALELLRDLEKDTVHWSRNFDDSTKEPDMLPGRYPNLLVNGASGIAVGLATNIPPHNLNEVIDGVIAYIDNRNITLNQMMKIIKGPDFPTGGYIICGDGLKQAYDTGKGKILLRAKVHIEVAPNDRRNIVIDELPYNVNKSDLLIKIAALKEEKKEQLQGIAEIVDESDKEGMRAVIKLRKDCDAQSILNLLYKYTALQTTFGINMVAIADGKPQLMGLLDIIAYYTAYQREVVLRRSKYELEQARAQETDARNNLSYTEVKSPSDGVVGTLPYRVGALVGASLPQPLTTVSDNSSMYVYFSMTENQLRALLREYGSPDSLLRKMPSISLQLNDGTLYGGKGRIESISGVINQQTGTVSVRSVFPNEDRLLLSGGIGNVIIPHRDNAAIVIPQTATTELQDKILAYKVAEDNTVSSVEIKVDKLNDGKQYIVRSGLTAGDVIVAEGVGTLRDGVQITIKDERKEK